MYEKTFNLNDDEIAAKINSRTGEVTEFSNRPNNIPEDKEIHLPKEIFNKSYQKSWDYLLDKLTPIELKIVMKMASMARMNSNSLSPLNNESTSVQIAEKFSIHRNHVKKIFNNLFAHGVYAEFKVYTTNGLRHDWVLNPYISFRGKTIDKALVDLFRGTELSRLYIKDKE